MFYKTSLKDFKKYYLNIVNKTTGFALVPIVKETLADLETPVNVYNTIRSQTNNHHTFILESAEDISKNGRYSIVGFNPFLVFSSKDKKCKIEIFNQEFSGISALNTADPISSLKKLLLDFNHIQIENGPPLLAGAVGYIGYDSIRLIEDIPFNVETDLGNI